jgi:thioredoxin reductase (NADPH)
MSASRKFDIIILGTGPAGLQAAIHAARRKVSVLVLGKETKSSLFSAHVENFCCIFKLSGEEMITTGRQQAANFGAQFMAQDVLNIHALEKGFEIKVESGEILKTKSLIIATGTQRKRLGAKGEKELLGKGVSYCVDCDGNFYRGQDVAVVGGESAAVDGALTLTEIARSVHLVFDQLDVADDLKTQLESSSVKCHSGVKVERIEGESEVQSLVLDNGQRLDISGVFIEQGAKGIMELATTLGILLDDDMQYIAADKKQATNIGGIYAAGDVCGPPWQMAKAVGEGCVAGLNAAKYAKQIETMG